ARSRERIVLGHRHSPLVMLPRQCNRFLHTPQGQPMRLSHATIRPAGKQISIRFDGQTIPALEGETIAAALSAAGIVAFRRTLGGAPRGLYCGMGACFDCV